MLKFQIVKLFDTFYIVYEYFFLPCLSFLYLFTSLLCNELFYLTSFVTLLFAF